MPTSNWANNWGSRKGFLYKRVPGPWPWYESGDWRFINPLAGMHNKKPEKRFASLQLRMKAAKTVKTEADATLRQAIGTLRFEIAQHELGQCTCAGGIPRTGKQCKKTKGQGTQSCAKCKQGYERVKGTPHLCEVKRCTECYPDAKLSDEREQKSQKMAGYVRYHELKLKKQGKQVTPRRSRKGGRSRRSSGSIRQPCLPPGMDKIKYMVMYRRILCKAQGGSCCKPHGPCWRTSNPPPCKITVKTGKVCKKSGLHIDAKCQGQRL